MENSCPDIRGVVCQVQEQSDTLHTAVLLKVPREEATCLQVDTHGTEDDGEVVLVVVVHALVGLSNQTGLSTNLGGDFVVGETGRRKDGNLLATGDRVHRVDGGDTGGNHFLGVHLGMASAWYPLHILQYTHTRVGVDRTTVDIEVVLGQDLGALVNRPTRAVEDAPQHVLGHAELQTLAREFDFCLQLSEM